MAANRAKSVSDKQHKGSNTGFYKQEKNGVKSLCVH